MKKFLKDLEEELKKNNLNEKEIEEIISDHEEMIESAIKEGLTEKQLEEKFGNPVEVAKELSQFTEKAKDKNEKQKYLEFDNVKDNYDIEIGLINEDVQFELFEEDKIILEYHGKRGLSDYEISFDVYTSNFI